MQVLKTAKQFFTKAMQTIGLQDHGQGDNTLFELLGRDYRFGTQSKDFLMKAYGGNPYVFMVIDRICQRLVQVDKRLLDRMGQETEDIDFQELLKAPNTRENGDSFLYRASATYLATGECFIVRQQKLEEEDQYIVPINYNVTINQDTRGNVISYWVSMFGNSETFLPGEVLHIHKPDITTDTNHGFSTLRATRKVWESNNEVWASEASLHKNKGITGILYSDGNRPMTDTEQKELQGKYDTDHTGTNNFGKVKVSTSKLGYQQMGMNPNDLKSIETRLEHLRTVCASFNVDSKLFGDSASSTYNNMAEAQRAFIVNAVIPLGKLILPQLITFMARSVFQSYTMVLDEENITELQLTKEQKSTRLGREVIQGILTAEQARGMLYPELVEELEGQEQPEPTVRENITVNDIIQLQTNITQELITREGAIAILMQIYGLDEQTANDILG